MEKFAEVIVNSEAVTIDKPFTYKIKEDLVHNIKVGHRVLIPFGNGNKKIEGFVLKILDNVENKSIRYKSIYNVCDNEPLLSEDSLKLIKFLREKYLCKYIDAIRVMIPPKIMSGNKEKTKQVIVFKKYIEELSEPQKRALELIEEKSGGFTKAEWNKIFNISTYMINKLIELGCAFSEEVRVGRENLREFKPYPPKSLNEEQIRAYDTILESDKNIFLLKGVTGSGKTEVYMNLVSYMLLFEKSSLILVPEIALTPQMIERFKGRFGKDVAVFHSRLSDGERYDEWYRVKNDQVKVVIGARSAIFLPFNDLGLIVVDEEHESSYKSDMNPKYNTIEVCEYLSVLKNCKVVLGSATPSVVSFYKALKGNYELIELKKRVNNGELPNVSIVDMRGELKSNNKTMFSRDLYLKIKDRLEKKEQIILFLNRRGFSSFVSCRSCGFVFKCNNCDISMTYHNNGYLVCHYCGNTEKMPKLCPKCGSNYVKHFGVGTEKLEEAVHHYFREAKVLRMDVDTTRKKNSHEEIYNSFKSKEADILIGTQMIAKGLDFPDVTLVGVMAADMSLNLPDYKSSEKTFQLITQVSGRAGRGDKKGDVIIQSYYPEHYALTCARDNNYEEFFKREINVRKLMAYPPFDDLFLINLSAKGEIKVKIFAKKLEMYLRNILKEYDNIFIYEACPCSISKIKNVYRWQILIKGKLDLEVCSKIKKGVYELSKDVYNEIKIGLDINPNSLM
ncbi:primosomal protein N' [Clostridium perfringens]|uniref:primosomal protein N' n=1 Tax=Clostridium perfringens TaxID=1502 RepID=UPI0024BD0F21|nr:primosomal protein N' [Clostridium perfringens]